MNAKNDPSKCVILVPYMNRIEHDTDAALRILESRGYEVWRTPGYSAIDQARNRMAYDALYRRGFDEIMWVDADVEFDPDDFEKLRSHNLPVCAAAYPFKGYPRFTIETFNEEPLVFGSGGSLVKVKSAATGFLLIRKPVFEAVRKMFRLPLCNTSFDNPMIPFFHPQMFYENREWFYLGEDFSFCRMAAKAGFDIWLDTTVRLKHIGQYAYQWEDVVRPAQPDRLTGVFYDPQATVQGGTGDAMRGASSILSSQAPRAMRIASSGHPVTS